MYQSRAMIHVYSVSRIFFFLAICNRWLVGLVAAVELGGGGGLGVLRPQLPLDVLALLVGVALVVALPGHVELRSPAPAGVLRTRQRALTC